jgi:hypothetical protein
MAAAERWHFVGGLPADWARCSPLTWHRPPPLPARRRLHGVAAAVRVPAAPAGSTADLPLSRRLAT